MKIEQLVMVCIVSIAAFSIGYLFVTSGLQNYPAAANSEIYEKIPSLKNMNSTLTSLVGSDGEMVSKAYEEVPQTEGKENDDSWYIYSTRALTVVMAIPKLIGVSLLAIGETLFYLGATPIGLFLIMAVVTLITFSFVAWWRGRKP